MRKRIRQQSIQDLEASIAFGRALLAEVERLTANNIFDPITKEIAESAGRFHILPTALLALSKCRFSEIKQLDLARAIDRKVQTIRQKKTGESRLISHVKVPLEYDTSPLDPTARIMWTNYDSLRLELLDNTPSNVRTILKYQNDKTHIFRHLHATWLDFQGVKLSDISEFFAHQSEKATREYINTGLHQIFESKTR